MSWCFQMPARRLSRNSELNVVSALDLVSPSDLVLGRAAVLTCKVTDVPGLPGNPFASSFSAIGDQTVLQKPLLTCFIPSLPFDTPFKISLHNWKQPGPSEQLVATLTPKDHVLFEARVLIDGFLIAYIAYSTHVPTEKLTIATAAMFSTRKRIGRERLVSLNSICGNLVELTALETIPGMFSTDSIDLR